MNATEMQNVHNTWAYFHIRIRRFSLCFPKWNLKTPGSYPRGDALLDGSGAKSDALETATSLPQKCCWNPYAYSPILLYSLCPDFSGRDFYPPIAFPLIMTWFLFFFHWFSYLYLSKSLPCLKAVDKGGVKSVGSSLSRAGWGVPKVADAPSAGAVAQGMAHLPAHRWWRQGASATLLVPQHSGQDARLGTGPGRPHLTWVHS